MRRSFWLAGLALAFFSYPSLAQNNTARVVTTCGTVSPFPTAGQPAYLTVDVNGKLCDTGTSSNSLPAYNAPRTARGTTITAGGTSQTLMAANSSRKGFEIQNPCSSTTQNIPAAESLFINFTSAATVNTSANGVELAPCASYSEGLNGGAVSQEAITVIGATTGHIIYAKEF